MGKIRAVIESRAGEMQLRFHCSQCGKHAMAKLQTKKLGVIVQMLVNRHQHKEEEK